MEYEKLNIIKDEIRKAVNIVDEVSKFKKLKKTNQSFICECPLCSSENTTFVINRSNERFYCFNCHKGRRCYRFF